MIDAFCITKVYFDISMVQCRLLTTYRTIGHRFIISRTWPSFHLNWRNTFVNILAISLSFHSSSDS